MEELIFIFVFFFLVKYGQIREIFHVGYLDAWGASPAPFDSPCPSLTCLIKCFLASLEFISHIHQTKSPLKVFGRKGVGPSVETNLTLEFGTTHFVVHLLGFATLLCSFVVFFSVLIKK